MGVHTDISERKQFEQELAAKEEQIRNLISNLPATVYRCLADAELSPIFISHQVEELTGYQPQEFLDKKVMLGNLIHPDDLQMVRSYWEQYLQEDREVYQFEYRLQHCHGQVRWILDKGKVVRGPAREALYWEGVMLDQTEQKLTELALLESQDLYRSVIESMEEGVVVHEPSGAIVSCNRSAERI